MKLIGSGRGVKMDILMPIKPLWADRILNGQKQVEFRKSSLIRFTLKTDLIFIYSSMPVRKIIGHFGIKEIIEDAPKELWIQFKDSAGMNEKEFFDYFQGKKIGYAIRIDLYRKYDSGIDLREISKDLSPPQSYIYLNSQFAFKILEIANKKEK